MTLPKTPNRLLPWATAVVLLGLAAGCKDGGAGSRAPVLAVDGNVGLIPAPVPPRVSSTVPATSIPGPTLGVATNAAISASFTMDLAPATLSTATFTVKGPNATVVPGAVSYAARTAVFTPTVALAMNTTYTVSIGSAVTSSAGTALAGNLDPVAGPSNYVWTFTTGALTDATRPQVALTIPATTVPGPTQNLATNTLITALFTEDMDPASITAASFKVSAAAPGVAPLGQVTYSVASRTAIFTPSAVLAQGVILTATLTSAIKDLAGNALAGNQAPLPGASDYVWSFQTASLDVTPPTVTFTAPADAVSNVALNASVNATFSEAMDPLSISTATFSLQQSGSPLGPVIAGAVVYDPLSHLATLTPASPLANNATYLAKVSGAKDLAGNLLVPGLVPNPWTFTTGAGLAPGAIALGSASAFGIMATSAVTSTGFTVINGNVSLDPGTSMSGFPAGIVNGSININNTVSALARADLLVAYNSAKALPPGIPISAGADLGALYPLGMPPGTYTSGSTMLVSTPLVLDGGGNGNAVWVFQIGSSLTTSASIVLTNGAKAKNVFWVPTLDATVGVGSTFHGTVISGRDVTGVTGAVINGRILAGATLAGTIALDSNTVNVPAS